MLKTTTPEQLAEIYETERQRALAVIDAVDAGVLVTNQSGNIVMFNRMAHGIFGYLADEVIGKPLGLLAPDVAADREIEPDSILGHTTQRGEVNAVRKGGEDFPAEISLSKITVNGVTETVVIVRDISNRMAMLDEMRENATTDPLTGLKNRGYLLERCAEVQSVADRYRNPVTVLIIDIDDFRNVNEQHGFSAGDSVLQALSRTCEKVLRRSDVLARIGGEEFIALMPETPMDKATEVAERLRKQFAENRVDFKWQDGPIPFTVSIGIAAYDSPRDKTLEDTIKRADEALFRAKQMGRNRVVRALGRPGVAEPELQHHRHLHLRRTKGGTSS